MVTVKLKAFFFDRDRVLRAVGRTRAKALGESGKRIRYSAIGSIKDRKGGSSPPGQPPYSHVGYRRRRENRRRKALGIAPKRGGFRGIKHILYGYDPVSESVVIGPIGLSGSSVPNVLETGGVSKRVVRRDGKWVAEPIRIAARPFMGPALKRELPSMPRRWAGQVKG